MKRLIILLLFASLAPAAHGQKKWTLQECMDYAAANNTEIRQQQIAVENSEIELDAARSRRLPSVSASAGQSFGIGRSPSIATGVYESSSSSGTSYGISAGMTLFEGGAVNNRIRAGKLDLQAAIASLDRTWDDLSLRVASLYLEALFKKELLALAGERVALTSRQVERTGVMVEEQSVARSQLYDIEAQLANDELAATMARNDLDLALLDLAQLLNLADTYGFDIADPEADGVIAESRSNIMSPDEIYQLALGVKPQVAEAELRLRSSEYGVKAARAGFLPSVSIGLSHNNGFNHNLESGFSNPAIGTQLKNNRRESVGLSVNIPIFSQRQNRNNMRAARLAVDSRRIELERVKTDLFKEIQQAHQGAVAALAQYASTEKAQQAAAEAYRHAVERYNERMSTAFELSEAQNKLITSRSEQLQAKYRFLFRTKILDFYRGLDIEL